MTHAVAMGASLRGLLERQQARGREDLAASHDDGAVVQRRPRHEDRGEKLRRELPVHRDTRLAVVLEPGRAFQDDERAVLGLADQESRTHELVDDSLDLLLSTRQEQAVQRTELADLAERSTQLGLKHHHERNEGDGEEGLQKQGGESELQRTRDPVDEHEHEDAYKELDRFRPADEDEHVVDEDGDDDHVEDVVPAKGLTVEEIAEQPVELLVDLLHLIIRPWTGPRPPARGHFGRLENRTALVAGTLTLL